MRSGRSSAAGAPIDGDYQDSQQEIVVRNEVPRGADEVITIAGDSMEPLLMKGSQVFVHYQPVPDDDGQIVIVSIKDVGVTCKKIYREDGKIRLKSINDKYDDMVFPAQDVRVIGKVITQKKKP
jgi:phage repressor protein C with HTH and peptisase S24 domain